MLIANMPYLQNFIFYLGAQLDLFYEPIDNKTLTCTKTQIIILLRWQMIIFRNCL